MCSSWLTRQRLVHCSVPGIERTLRNRGHQYNGYPVSAGYFGAFSLDGLAIALHCVYHTSSFNEAIVKCAPAFASHCRGPCAPAAPLTSSRLRPRGRYQLLRGRGHDRRDLCPARWRVLRCTRHRRRVGGGDAPVGEGRGRATRNRALCARRPLGVRTPSATLKACEKSMSFVSLPPRSWRAWSAGASSGPPSP